MGKVIIFFHPKFAAQSSLKKDTPLYHIFPLEYFNKMIECKTLYFRRVVTWSDTHEYPIRFMEEDRKNVIEKSLFGFCFAQEYNKEAMWKLYSEFRDDSGVNNMHGVCIKTTAGDICKSLQCFKGNPNWINAFIGKVKYVKYLNDDPSEMFFESDKTEYPDYMYPAYIKRKEFEYEQEVRISLFYPLIDKSADKTSDGIAIELQDFSFINEIILSPYYPNDDIPSFNTFCNEHNIKVSINQSDLLKEIQENSVSLPADDKVYWGGPKDCYNILQ